MSSGTVRLAYPNPDDVPAHVAEAVWDIHREQNIAAASKVLRNFFGTVEWVLKTAEEVFEVNSLKLTAAEKLKLRSAFLGVPIEDLKKRKK